MKDKLNRPCRSCPFKRVSTPGWLGSATAQEFIEDADRQVPMPCHMTVDYSDPNWLETLKTDEVSYCAGAAIYLSNSASMPRRADWAYVVRRLGADRVSVFSWRGEFLDHHDNEMNRRYVEESQKRRKA